MRNPVLCAERLFEDGEVYAPEYANNKLNIHLTFYTPLTDTREVSVYIYTDEDHFMGSDVHLMPLHKKVRRLHFEVCAETWWQCGTYHIFVMRNGQPRWTGELRISVFGGVMSRCELKDNFDFTLPPREETDALSCDEDADEFERLLEEFIKNEQDEDSDKAGAEMEETVEPSAEERLQEMVGLSRVKCEVAEARMLALFHQKRRELGLDDSVENRHHMLFLGAPGTGKTTVARLIGEMYHRMGLLSKGHTVTTNRTELVGEYIGHTERQMRETIEKARGGVLFIDEAYTLVRENSSNDFGQEVVNALLVLLAEPDPDMIVILAGYEDKMEKLIKSNPGLRERFPLRLHFEDYSSEELFEIALRLCRSRNYELSPDAEERLHQTMANAWASRDRHFGNGRWVHNLMEHGIIKSMAKRVMSGLHCCGDKQLFTRIEECDIMAAEQLFLPDRPLDILSSRRIGFTA